MSASPDRPDIRAGETVAALPGQAQAAL